MDNHAAPKSPLLVAFIQLAALLFFIYYTFIGGQTAQGIYDPHWRRVTLWLTTLLLTGWLLWRLVSRTHPPRTLLDGPLLALLAAWLLAALFSVNQTYSREATVFFVAYLGFFYLAADIGRRAWARELILNAVIGVSGLIWTLGLWQLLRWFQSRPPVPPLLAQVDLPLDLPRLTVLGNANTMAAYIALVTPVVVYKLLTVRRRVSRLLLALWLLLLTFSLMLTQSRGGLLGWIAGLAAFALFITRFRLPQSWSRRTWPALAALLLALTLLLWPTLARSDLSAATAIRRQVGVAALKTLAVHPLFGAGPGALGQELIRWQEPLDKIWADAHNLYLTLAAETGLVGLAALLWLAVAAARQLRRDLLVVTPLPNPSSAAACAAGLLGFAAHNLVDSLFKFPLLMLIVAVWAGFWLASDRNASPATGWPRPVILIVVALLLATFWMGSRDLRHMEHYTQAVEMASYSDWPGARQALLEAAALAPELSFYRRQLGLVTGFLAAHTPAYRPEAIGHYQAALSQVSRLAIDHANMACLLWEQGQPAAARLAAARAVSLAPDEPLYRLNLARYLEPVDEAAAKAEYAAVLAARPDWLESHYWRQSPARAGLAVAAARTAAQQLAVGDMDARLRQVDLLLVLADLAAARRVAEAIPEPSLRTLARGRVLLAEGRPAEARAEFEAAIDVDPRRAPAYLGVARAALAQKDWSAAARYANAALYLQETPEALLLAGLVAAHFNRPAEALARWEAAFKRLTPATNDDLIRYATETARRRPLPQAYLPCLTRLYPDPLLASITLAEGDLLEVQGNNRRAAQVYRRLLEYAPATRNVAARLESLCRTQPEVCDFEKD